MQQFTVNIPDNKIDFFIELADNLGLDIEQVINGSILTDEQIALVNKERQLINENTGHFTDWEEARKSLRM